MMNILPFLSTHRHIARAAALRGVPLPRGLTGAACVTLGGRAAPPQPAGESPAPSTKYELDENDERVDDYQRDYRHAAGGRKNSRQQPRLAVFGSPTCGRPRGSPPPSSSSQRTRAAQPTSEVGHRVEHAYDLVLERVWLVVQAVAGAELGEAPPVCGGGGRRQAVRPPGPAGLRQHPTVQPAEGRPSPVASCRWHSHFLRKRSSFMTARPFTNSSTPCRSGAQVVSCL